MPTTSNVRLRGTPPSGVSRRFRAQTSSRDRRRTYPSEFASSFPMMIESSLKSFRLPSTMFSDSADIWLSISGMIPFRMTPLFCDSA